MQTEVDARLVIAMVGIGTSPSARFEFCGLMGMGLTIDSIMKVVHCGWKCRLGTTL